MTNLIITCFLAGILGSILQGMIGIGTGVIIVPLLSLMLPHFGISCDQAMHIALCTSMAAIALNSITALIGHHQKDNIDWVIFKKMIFFSLLGTICGVYAACIFPASKLKIAYGLFLIAVANYMLRKKEKKGELENMPHFSRKSLAGGGFGIGFVASLIGSGGGILMVPFLHSKNVIMRKTVGTSTLVGLPIAIIGGFTYILIGLTEPTCSHTVGFLHWPAFVAISLAGILGAPLGVKLASTLPANVIRRVFALCLFVIGLKMSLSFIFP